jgi:hypothetical protein
MISVVMGLFAVITTEVWLWAGLYRLLDIFADFETALYFRPLPFQRWAMATSYPLTPGVCWRHSRA